jgi:hypothetical protein
VDIAHHNQRPVAAEPGRAGAAPGSKTLTHNIKENVEVKQMLTSFSKKLIAKGES